MHGPDIHGQAGADEDGQSGAGGSGRGAACGRSGNGSDFEWMKDLNSKAQADPSGFKASLAARFKIGDAQITAVLSNVEKPADAYMVLRLGEMSGQPTDRVTERYRSAKGQGWGNLAKSLGIKPGSKEFHALKRGHDLDGGGSGKNKWKGKGQGKGRDKD